MAGIKNTPMRDFHVEMGAKMVPFCGWNMPLAFPDGSAAEHKHTLASCSIFDDTPAGKFQISGGKTAKVLDKLCAFPVADLAVGQCRHDLLLSEEGGVLETLTVCRMREEDFFIIGTAANVLKDSTLFQSAGLTFRNLTEDLGKIDITGPKALEVVEKSGVKMESLPEFNHCSVVEIDGLHAIMIHFREGFELLVTADCADQIWDLLLDTEIAEPAGLAARESLRIEAGVPAWGAELRSEWSPLDSGVDLDLVCARDFTGRKALLNRPRQRRFVMAKIEGKRAPRAGAEVLNAAGAVIGVVTSGAFCPAPGCGVALCSLEFDAEVKADEPLAFRFAGEEFSGTVTCIR